MADYKNNISSDEDEGRYEDTEVILDRYYQHINALGREGKHKECLSLCSKAIEIADDTRNPRLVKANIRMFMASIFKDLKKYELAILQVEEVLTTVKKREWSQLLLEYQEEYAEDEHWQGCSFRDREKYFEALQFFDHSIKICPNIQQFYISRAICHLKMKNYKQCIYDCEEGHRCPGYSNPKCYLVQGIAFASLNKFVQARACYKKVIQLDPFNETARHEFENTLKKTCLYADSDGPANTQFQLKPFY
uniref:TPR_REGION domain-containing protein n=1 Tax=Rhabditophanes sp. KR3021 TaxID=114890 RepID=A0AC35TG70_9BILA